MSRASRSILSRRLRRHRIPATLWLEMEKNNPLLARFGSVQRLQLRVLASEILRRKLFSPGRDMVLTEAIKVHLATEIAVVIHALQNPGSGAALRWLRNWKEVIVYPRPFRPHRRRSTPLGGSPLGLVMHSDPVELGETSYQGPLVVQWQVAGSRQASPIVPSLVMVHELVHKLDMLDGGCNGHPPLHAGMDQQQWHDELQAAYDHLVSRLEAGHRAEINPYAATSPAEFFAVCSEYFFGAPEVLHAVYPSVYRQLSLFYRQQPLGAVRD